MKLSREELKKALLLYAVTDKTWLKEGETLPDVCEALIKGGVTFVQLREKNADKDSLLKEAQALCELCGRLNVPFVVNDDIETALAVKADGVHLGQDDIKGVNPRQLIGEDMILGISAHNVEEALAAQACGADYLGVGAVFGTSTKADANSVSLDTLREICAAVKIPVVAIGGINADNIVKLTGCGVVGAAIVSALFAADDYEQAATTLLAKAKEII